MASPSATALTLPFSRPRDKRPGGGRSILTVEVDNRRRLVIEVKGRCNRSPYPYEPAGLRRWAEDDGPAPAPWVLDKE